MLAFVSFEAQAEGLLESVAQRCQGGQVGALDLQAGVVRVGSQDRGHIARFRERRVVQQHAAQKLPHPFAMIRGGFARMEDHAPEVVRGVRQREGFQNARLPARVPAHQGEGAEVGHQHHAVAHPIALDLRRFGDPANVLGWRFGFDDAARGILGEEGVVTVIVARVPGELIGGKQSAIRQAGAAIREVDHAADAGRQGFPESGQEIFKSWIERCFRHMRARPVHFRDIRQIFFDRVIRHSNLIRVTTYRTFPLGEQGERS